MRKMIVYPNCSKGGVSSVIRGRASSEPGNQFDVFFLNDRGGREVFADLPNVDMRIVGQGRMKPFLDYVTKTHTYDGIHVLSAPEFANQLSANHDLAVTYEFHSSNMSIVEQEISKLELDRLTEIYVPSQQMRHWVSERVLPRIRPRVKVVPNLVDENLFSTTGDTNFFDRIPHTASSGQSRPLVWVGRFDRDKGYHYFLRTLALLPKEYYGVAIVSLENEPQRAEKFFAECDAMQVRDRVQLYMNLSQQDMADLYRSASKLGGVFVSTSLMESFGYAVSEAVSCGLPVAAFDLPVWTRFEQQPDFVSVPPGEVLDLADAVRHVSAPVKLADSHN